MKKFVVLFLCFSFVFLFTLSACGKKAAEDSDTPSPDISPLPTETSTADVSPSATPGTGSKVEVNFAVLPGSTGMGAAKLMADNDAGITKNHYTVTVETDNNAVSTKLINGEYDIAAVATNLASTLYHKTNGGVQLAAINTLGVLYILGRDAGGTANSLSQLSGKTVLAFGQGANPEYVLDYLLTENGLDPDRDMDIQWMGTADEVTAAMLSGKSDWCMLPVPAASALTAKSKGSIQPVFDLSAEWDALQNGSQLTMGCVVVRTAFAQEHPQAVKDFLEEYAASITYMNDEGNLTVSSDLNPVRLLVNYGLLPSESIAAKALPSANLVCITGEEMREIIQGYYEVLFKADPKAIGGSIPDDAFYFLGG